MGGVGGETVCVVQRWSQETPAAAQNPSPETLQWRVCVRSESRRSLSVHDENGFALKWSATVQSSSDSPLLCFISCITGKPLKDI